MKTYKEYVEKGFVGAPELYLKNGDEIDIALAAELISGTDMDVADLEAWDGGILQSTHPADTIASQGTFDTIYRRSWMKPFIYKGQCFAGKMINKNPELSRYVYICSAYNAESEKERTANLMLARKYCRCVVNEGNIPIAPHAYFTKFMDDQNEVERSLGQEIGIELLKKADSMIVLIRNERISAGMEREIKYAANKLGIPIDINYLDRKGR